MSTTDGKESRQAVALPENTRKSTTWYSSSSPQRHACPQWPQGERQSGRGWKDGQEKYKKKKKEDREQLGDGEGGEVTMMWFCTITERRETKEKRFYFLMWGFKNATCASLHLHVCACECFYSTLFIFMSLSTRLRHPFWLLQRGLLHFVNRKSQQAERMPQSEVVHAPTFFLYFPEPPTRSCASGDPKTPKISSTFLWSALTSQLRGDRSISRRRRLKKKYKKLPANNVPLKISHCSIHLSP